MSWDSNPAHSDIMPLLYCLCPAGTETYSNCSSGWLTLMHTLTPSLPKSRLFSTFKTVWNESKQLSRKWSPLTDVTTSRSGSWKLGSHSNNVGFLWADLKPKCQLSYFFPFYAHQCCFTTSSTFLNCHILSRDAALHGTWLKRLRVQIKGKSKKSPAHAGFKPAFPHFWIRRQSV